MTIVPKDGGDPHQQFAGRKAGTIQASAASAPIQHPVLVWAIALRIEDALLSNNELAGLLEYTKCFNAFRTN